MRNIYLILGCLVNIVWTIIATPDSIPIRKKLLERIQSGDEQYEDKDFLLTLTIAVQYDFNDVIELILKNRPAIIESYTTMNENPLYQATINGFEKSIKSLLSHGAAILLDLQDQNQMTVVHIAVAIGNKKIIKTLIEHKLDLRSIDNHNNSIIKLLINKHNQTDETIEIARMLLVRHAYYDTTVINQAQNQNWPWLVGELQEREGKGLAISSYVHSEQHFFCAIQ